MEHESDTPELEQVYSLEIRRIQSSRFRAEGGPLEESELKKGIEREIDVVGGGRKRIITFPPGDPDNPHNWSNKKKWLITFAGILSVSNSTFSSSLPSGAIVFIQDDFNIESIEVATLTMSLFLVGYVVGPIFFAPTSEFYGRRWVSVGSFGWYIIATILCAVAPNIGALLAFRFLAGIGASAPLSVVGGIFADIWNDPIQRGRNMAIFAAVTMIGPTISPIISGFVSASYLGWRFTFWIAVLVGVLSYIPVILCPETFAPVLLLKRARRLREAGADDVMAPLELDDRSVISIFKTTLTRPFRMFFKESILLLTSLFLSLIYGTFYLFFQSYPIIYQGIYGFGPGIAGLPFIPVGLGAGLAIFGVVFWDRHLRTMERNNKEITAEYRRLPLACMGGPVYVISMFWQAWTSRADVHWIVPVLAGLPFGFGFTIIFISYLNYLTDFYEIYAASALAASSMCRSIFGAAFPLFAKRMYGKLGVSWASSLLGFLALVMSLLPFLFIKYGDEIRSRSTFYQFLKERKEMLPESEIDPLGDAGDEFEEKPGSLRRDT